MVRLEEVAPHIDILITATGKPSNSAILVICAAVVFGG